jgi:hypothetical protein
MILPCNSPKAMVRRSGSINHIIHTSNICQITHYEGCSQQWFLTIKKDLLNLVNSFSMSSLSSGSSYGSLNSLWQNLTCACNSTFLFAKWMGWFYRVVINISVFSVISTSGLACTKNGISNLILFNYLHL